MESLQYQVCVKIQVLKKFSIFYSKGVAALVAAKCVILSIGSVSDVGGSVRGPTAFCGCYGNEGWVDTCFKFSRWSKKTTQHRMKKDLKRKQEVF